jgi:UDP-3-O-[3-hydroxymyristoyl] glucosamine N-acyltransferase
VRPAHADRLPDEVGRLITDEPYRGYARIAATFHPEAAAPGADHPPRPAIAAGAQIDPGARIGPGCRIASGAVIEADAEIGPRCRIEANAVIGAGVRLDADCIVGPGATLSHCLIGARVVIHAGARIGQDGFGFALGSAGALKVPQVGRVLIDDDVEIGANTTIDRGSSGDTHCVVVAQSGISGSTQIGAGSMLAAQVGITGHLTLGPAVRLAARSAVIRDLPGDDTYGGAPAVPIRQWRRQMAAISRLGRTRGSK